MPGAPGAGRLGSLPAGAAATTARLLVLRDVGADDVESAGLVLPGTGVDVVGLGVVVEVGGIVAARGVPLVVRRRRRWDERLRHGLRVVDRSAVAGVQPVPDAGGHGRER